MTHSKKKAFFLGLITHSSAFLANRKSLSFWKHIKKSLRKEDLGKMAIKSKISWLQKPTFVDLWLLTQFCNLLIFCILWWNDFHNNNIPFLYDMHKIILNNQNLFLKIWSIFWQQHFSFNPLKTVCLYVIVPFVMDLVCAVVIRMFAYVCFLSFMTLILL